MHDGNNPNAIGLFEENDCVRKIVAEMSARRWIKFPETLGIGCHRLKQAFHLAIETHAEFGRNFAIISDRPGKFLVCFGMKQDFHSPAALRARASDSSSGTPFTLPVSISCMRRSISFFQE